jgi:hypothetical protein
MIATRAYAATQYGPNIQHTKKQQAYHGTLEEIHYPFTTVRK